MVRQNDMKTEMKDWCDHQRFVQEKWRDTIQWQNVCEISNLLIQYLNEKEIAAQISVANQPGLKSSAIQSIDLKKTIELGFIDESKGLFSDYKNSRLRPDYYKKIGGDSGILIEVERGKTNQNNMDFLDFWKCHICKYAHYLFLLVPKELRQNQSGKIVGRPYQTVVSHMETLFYPENYTSVRGVVVIGY